MALLTPALTSRPSAARAPPGATASRPLQDSQRQGIARRHFQQGKVCLVQRKYARATELFLKAYEYWDHPAVLFNLANAYALSKNPIRARVHLRLYLERTKSDPKRLPRILRTVLEQTAVLIVTIREAPTDIAVFVDGRWAGSKRTEVVLMPGQRAVEIRLGNQVLRQRAIELHTGGEHVWELDRVEPPPPPRCQAEPLPPPPPPPPPPLPLPPPPRQRLHWVWVAAVGGAAVALGVAALGTSVANTNIHQDFLKDPYNRSLASLGRSMQVATNVLWGFTATAAVAAGTLAFFTRWKPGEAPQTGTVEPAVGPGTVQLTVHW